MNFVKNSSPLLVRSHHTVNTLKIPITKSNVLKHLKDLKLKTSNFRHYLFGGEVYDPQLQMRVASNDLIVVEQTAEVASKFTRVESDPLVPGCYNRNELF